LFARVGAQIVKLRDGRADVVMLAVDQRMEIAPSEMESGIERLAINRPDRSPTVEHRQERPRVTGSLRDFRVGLLEDGRKHVRQLDRSVDRLAGVARSRQLHEKRNLQRLAIEEDSMLFLAVLVQPFAMIG